MNPSEPWSLLPVSCDLTPEGAARAGQVSLITGSLHYLNLNGSLGEMAARLGALAPQRSPALALSDVVRSSTLAPLASLLTASSDRLFAQRLRRHLPTSVLNAMTELADASGVPRGEVFNAHLMPEITLWLAQQTARSPLAHSSIEPLVHHHALLVPSASRPMLAANHRALDSPRRRAVTLVGYHPAERHSFVSVTYSGLIGAGHSAMNSAGLALTLHPLYVQGADRKGQPASMLTDAIMRRASSLEQAVALAERAELTSPFGLMLLEGDSGRALILEKQPGGATYLHPISPSSPPLAYTHEPLTHALRAAPSPLGPARIAALKRRAERQRELLEELATGELLPADAITYLADMGAGEDQGLSAAQIAHPGISSSVVFDPSQRRLWVAAADSGPASRGWFIPFELHPGRLRPCEALSPCCVEPGWPATPHGEASSILAEALRRERDGEPPKKLALRLEHALALWPSDPDLHVACGLLSLRAEIFTRARGALERALAMEQRPTRRTEIALYLAMSIDLSPHTRGQAKSLYRALERDGAASPRVAARARRWRRRRLRHEELLAIPLDLLSAGLHL